MTKWMAKLLINSNRRSQAKLEKERMQNGRGELFAEGLISRYDLPYRSDDRPQHTLDVISPEGEGRLPVIIEVHGGGYIACDKRINLLHCRAFAQMGFRVVNVNYTLVPEGDFFCMLQELADVVRWVADHAGEYGFDTSRVYLSGDSAGGHLVLLYCMKQGNAKMREFFGVQLPPLQIRAAAPTCPAYTFEYRSDTSNRMMNLLRSLVFPHGASRELLDMLDVTRLIPQSEFPPLFITTTPGDGLLYAPDLVLEQALAASGREYCFRSYESRGNTLDHVFNVLYPEYPESADANRDIAEFFLAHT
ncbi:MAG: alpha/beta hydrolase [Oscillospiraceae bacterium]|nr:alpha/beta hydrolase [Oscillospiraceae bacterium]